MKVSLKLVPLLLSIILSGCTTTGVESVQSLTPTLSPSKNFFSVFLNLDDSRTMGWGVYNVHMNTMGDHAMLFTCGEEQLSQLQEWYPPFESQFSAVGTLAMVIFSTEIKLLGSKGEVLALPVETKVNTDGSSRCSVEYTFENVPFDDLPFMVDLSEWKLEPTWFNAAEASDGNVYIELEKLDSYSE